MLEQSFFFLFQDGHLALRCQSLSGVTSQKSASLEQKQKNDSVIQHKCDIYVKQAWIEIN